MRWAGAGAGPLSGRSQRRWWVVEEAGEIMEGE